jgi:hypothetical protein
MKKVIILLVMLTLAVGILPAQTKKAPKAPKPTVGTVVSLNDAFLGSFTTWTKQTAVEAADKGTPFVLLVGTGKTAKIYFVLNEDGSFAGKKLAKFAFNKKIAVVGKVTTKNGLKFVVAELIDSVE